MNDEHDNISTRRRFIGAGLTGSAALALLGCGGGRSQRIDDANIPPPQPVVTSVDAGVAPVAVDEPSVCVATEDNIEGPYFKAGAPNRATLVEATTQGTRFHLVGRVVDVGCSSISSVQMEVWQANHAGAYDNKGYTFRGRMTTDADGRFELDTIIPGRYLNGRQYRPAHIHFMLAASGFRALTTQLYFDGDPYNDVDPWIRDSLVMKLSDRKTGGKGSEYDFVLAKS
jgi:protocatechuate 3,4-dioxygenase beta subunit